MPRPSLAHVAAVAFFALVAFPRSAIPLIDGDVWWHIRAGAEVLSSGRIPDVDSWSIVSSGMPWTSQDWLSNVLLALVYGQEQTSEVGATLASLLYAAMVVAAFGLLWLALDVRGARGWLGRVVWLTAGLIVAGPTIGVRVQVIDLALAAATLLLLWGHMSDGRWRWLVGLPFIAVAWANLHAGWILLFLLGGAVVVGELVDRHWRVKSDASVPRLVIALAVAAVAIAINPNGLDLYRYPFDSASITALRDYLAEWSPPDIGSIVGQLFAGFLVIGVIPALVLRTRQMRTADVLILLGLTVMAATAARFLLFVPLAAAIVCVAFDGSLDRSGVGSGVGHHVRRMADPARNITLATANWVLIGLILVAAAAVTWVRVGPAAQREAVAAHMPVSAVAWLLDHPVGERPFNTYSWGGYLGLHRPGLPVFIDGRADIYGDAPIREYARTVQLEVEPASTFERYAIDHVLFNAGTDLANWLDGSPAWERVFIDDVAGVWVRVPPESP